MVSRGFLERIRLRTRPLFFLEKIDRALLSREQNGSKEQTDGRSDNGRKKKNEKDRYTNTSVALARRSRTINLVVSRVLTASTRSDRTFVPRIQDGKLARDRASTHPRAPIAYFIFFFTFPLSRFSVFT